MGPEGHGTEAAGKFAHLTADKLEVSEYLTDANCRPLLVRLGLGDYVGLTSVKLIISGHEVVVLVSFVTGSSRKIHLYPPDSSEWTAANMRPLLQMLGVAHIAGARRISLSIRANELAELDLEIIPQIAVYDNPEIVPVARVGGL